MKMIQKAVLLLAIMSLACQSHISAAASDESSILSTIGELKREKVYSSAASEEVFLFGLQQALQDQARVIQLNRLKEIFDFEIDKRELIANRVNSQSKYFVEFCDRDVWFEIADPETVALILRYKSLFMNRESREFDAIAYAAIKHIVAEQKDSKNPELKEFVQIQEYSWDGLYLNHYRQTQILDPLRVAMQRFNDFKSNPLFLQLCKHTKSPLQFLNRSWISLLIWSEKQKERENRGAFTDHVDEADISYFDDCNKIAASYAGAADAIARLQKSIARELQLLVEKKAKAASSSASFVPVSVIQGQSKKRGQSGRGGRRSQRSTVAHASSASVASCSTDGAIPAASVPEEPAPVIAQQEITPALLLENVMVPVSIKRGYEPITYADGSYTIAEDDTCVEIYDAVNNQKITLFKVENPQQEYSKPCYTEWVQDWFTNPEEALARQGYNDVTSHRFKYRATARPVHGFTPLVDQFLPQCSTVTEIYNWKNKRKDISVTIPGMLGNKLGLFHYIVDRTTGEWYHRNFEERSGKGLVQEYARKGYYDVEFPELK